MAGGNDVLIFFDFMSLPQEGMDSKSTIIPRTQTEQEVFQECLPAMGLLYSTFPVLMLPEVTADVHPYSCSGWCFSEFSIATLGKQFKKFSPDAADVYFAEVGYSPESAAMTQVFSDAGRRGSAMAPNDIHSFLDMFDLELSQKRFFDESDKAVVHDIVHGFLQKRILLDAIARKDVKAATATIQRMTTGGLQEHFNQSVDDGLTVI
eukprot:TRINITY_DN38115_c0_g3_i1.p1 TRINITY_DN38115_c0_g3~~TRINITY_DN38115_c0_g3_i1.p1  ORF type:complete len:222 (-),score=39.46 TRINITY_DN38115_c0_g3_i1:35-655(-)